MMILNNEEVSTLLSMDNCLRHLEAAYKELSDGTAVNRPRSDLYLPATTQRRGLLFQNHGGRTYSGEGGGFALKLGRHQVGREGRAHHKRQSTGGAGQQMGRAGSVIFRRDRRTSGDFPGRHHSRNSRRGQQRARGAIPRPRRLCNCRDPRLRLAGTRSCEGDVLLSALSRKYWCTARRKRTAITSPPKWKKNSASRWTPWYRGNRLPNARIFWLPRPIRYRESIPPEWLKPGMHVTCVKITELGEETLGKADRLVIHTRKWAPENYIAGFDDEKVEAHDPIDLLTEGAKGSSITAKQPFWLGAPELKDVVAGKVPGRQSAEEITCFNNNIGLGIQFAALGKAIFDDAKAKGLGREIPTDWFLESVHP